MDKTDGCQPLLMGKIINKDSKLEDLSSTKKDRGTE